MYLILCLGYTPIETHATLAIARRVMQEMISNDLKKSRFKLTKIKNSPNSYTLVIGGKQGYHTYSAYAIVKQ